MEIINIDELEKEEPEDSTVNTSDYGDDIDDTTPAEAEETIEKADDIINEATREAEQSPYDGRKRASRILIANQKPEDSPEVFII